MRRTSAQPAGQHLAGRPEPARPRDEPARECLLATELDFYQGYAWCLNPFPTVRETVAHLGVEIERLQARREDWQTGEVMTNVYLLSCALLNAVDEYLRGKTLRLPGPLAAMPLVRGVRWVTEKLGALLRQLRRAHAPLEGGLAGRAGRLSRDLDCRPRARAGGPR